MNLGIKLSRTGGIMELGGLKVVLSEGYGRLIAAGGFRDYVKDKNWVDRVVTCA